ncbi:MAG: T9SS type A sorting domain-containing protein [Candidatus Marinimicrobia bacterium]|nr:T9SS type A sorting domain-containing protein [Candidatus Neomarinimicrobiota bacterium]MCH8068287.1 T9SS type A sorting domain-containing protein [Candidatus Neomarinimicrobiota bacterium]
MSLNLIKIQVVIFITIISFSFATTIHVPTDVDSIQGGINLANDGDTVLVAPRTYQESINFLGKDIIVMSELGMDSTIIQGDSTQRVVTFENGESYNAMLIGFTIENGNGGIICMENSNPTILRCKIRNNNATIELNTDFFLAGGGGIASINSAPLIMNSIIHQNETSRMGGGIYMEYSPLKLINSVIYNNQALEGSGILSIWSNNNIILNSIIWENDIFLGGFVRPIDILFSDIQSGWTGEGNIDQPPQFVDADNGDFHLLSSSPVVNTGHPMAFFNDFDGSRNNMGAYGGTGFSVEFMELKMGKVALQTNNTYPFKIYNLRSQPLTISSFTFSNPGSFNSNLSLPFEVPAYTIQEITVIFEPNVIGPYSSELTISLTDAVSTDFITINLKAEGVGFYGYRDFRRIGLLDAGLVSTLFKNHGQITDYPNEPSLNWPSLGKHYCDGVAFIIQAETEDISGNIIHPMETQIPDFFDAGPPWGFEPLPGYFNPLSNTPALSNQPQSWPTHWPNRPPEWDGYWDGFYGRGITTADQETYFVIDDYQDQEWDFYPTSEDTSRGGLGLVVDVRGYAWADPQYEDILIWHYTIKNISDFDYQKVVLGFYIDPGIGGIEDAGDDCGTYLPEEKMVYFYDTDGYGTPGNWYPVGYMGFKFLEMPGNPYDGIDNDGDGLVDESRDNGIDDDGDWNPMTDDVGMDGVMGTGDSGESDGIPTIGEPNFDKTDPDESDDLTVNTVRFFATYDYELTNDEENWQVFTSGIIDYDICPNNLAGFIISEAFPLHSGETTYFSMAIVFGEDLDDLLVNAGNIPSQFLELDNKDILPDKVQLYQNYPNPFNPITTIRYQLPQENHVSLKIYDIMGREVRNLFDQKVAVGNHQILWNSRNNNGKTVASGIYICQLKVGDNLKFQKMVLLK